MPLRMPCAVIVAGTTGVIVAPPPTLHGLQFACVMLISPLLLGTSVNVPLSVPSVAPAMVTLEPGAYEVNGDVVSMPALPLMVRAVSDTAAPGAVIVAAAPANGIDTPCPTAKSLVPPLHVMVFWPLVVAQMMVGGALFEYAP